MSTDQLELPGLTGLVEPTYSPDATIQERWEAWKAANPWVLPTVADDTLAGHGIAVGPVTPNPYRADSEAQR